MSKKQSAERASGERGASTKGTALLMAGALVTGLVAGPRIHEAFKEEKPAPVPAVEQLAQQELQAKTPEEAAQLRLKRQATVSALSILEDAKQPRVHVERDSPTSFRNNSTILGPDEVWRTKDDAAFSDIPEITTAYDGSKQQFRIEATVAGEGTADTAPLTSVHLVFDAEPNNPIVSAPLPLQPEDFRRALDDPASYSLDYAAASVAKVYDLASSTAVSGESVQWTDNPGGHGSDVETTKATATLMPVATEILAEASGR